VNYQASAYVLVGDLSDHTFRRPNWDKALEKEVVAEILGSPTATADGMAAIMIPGPLQNPDVYFTW
jgi:hypothetical protein